MSKNKTYCVLRTLTKTYCFSGSYDECMDLLNSKDKTFRRTHKIVPIKESRGYNNDLIQI